MAQQLIDWNVFDTNVREGSLRKVNEIITLWNANSGNALMLSKFAYAGGVFSQIKWDIDDHVEVLDIYDVNNVATSNTLGTAKQNTIKFFFNTGTYEIEGSNLSWIEQNQDQAVAELSNNIAEFVFRKYLFQLITVLVNTYEDNADVTNDESGGTVSLSQEGLNRSYSLFSDRSGAIILNLMYGTAKHKLIGDALENGAALFTAGDVTVIDIQGRKTVITDCPALIDNVSVPATYKVLCLTAGAGDVFETGDFKIVVEGDITGKDRLYTNIQGEGTASIRLKGYSYDAANGTSSPTSAELETGASWVRYVSSLKETGGVLYISDQVTP
jgi:hypothetical protein